MQEEAVALLVNGVVNVMRHLGMIEDARLPNLTSRTPKKIQNRSRRRQRAAPWLQHILTKFDWLYTKSTGVWYPKVAPGDAVGEGEQIGTVGDLFGDTLDEIASPVNGVVLFLTISPSVLENGLLMGIGVE